MKKEKKERKIAEIKKKEKQSLIIIRIPTDEFGGCWGRCKARNANHPTGRAMIFYSAFETALTVPLWSEAKLRKNSSASRVKESSWFFWFHRYHALDRFRCVTARCVRVCNWLRLVTCSENNAARCVSIIKPSTPGTPPRDWSDLEVSTKLLPRLLHRCRHRLRLLPRPVMIYAEFEKIQEQRNHRVGNWILSEFQRN